MLNKVMLIGRLGNDPEVHYTQDGSMVVNFRLATSEYWKDKNGEKKERTEWHRCVAFRKRAEICGNYLSKGKLIYGEGKIQTRKWEDKEGNERHTTEIILNNMQILDGKGGLSADKIKDEFEGSQVVDDDDVPF